MAQEPSYWAVLTADVRYAQGLPASAKLLYAEISSLTDSRGYCFASNSYFERLYGISDRTVQRLLRLLEQEGFIRIEDDSGGNEHRKIYGGVNPMRQTPDKNVGGPRQKCRGSPDKNVGENKKENKKDIIPPKSPQQTCAWEPEMFERFWRAYPRGEDKAGARREWDKLKPDRKLMEAMSAALDRAKASDDWQRGIGIPYACRWLSHRRWEDEPGSDLRSDTPPQRRTEAVELQKGDYML